MIAILFLGMLLKCLTAAGSKTIPEKIIRSDATWNAFKCNNPSFIIIKLLPQIIERTTKINQFKKPFFKIQILGKDGGFNITSTV